MNEKAERTLLGVRSKREGVGRVGLRVEAEVSLTQETIFCEVSSQRPTAPAEAGYKLF